MTAFSIFVPSIFFGHFVLPFQTFRFVDYKRPGNFFIFLFPSFYIFAKQNQTKYERHYIRKIKGIIPEEWL